jgi:hypothetical protein
LHFLGGNPVGLHLNQACGAGEVVTLAQKPSCPDQNVVTDATRVAGSWFLVEDADDVDAKRWHPERWIWWPRNSLRSRTTTKPGFHTVLARSSYYAARVDGILKLTFAKMTTSLGEKVRTE